MSPLFFTPLTKASLPENQDRIKLCKDDLLKWSLKNYNFIVGTKGEIQSCQ